MNSNKQKNRKEHIVLALIIVALLFLTFAVENSYYVMAQTIKTSMIKPEFEPIKFL